MTLFFTVGIELLHEIKVTLVCWMIWFIVIIKGNYLALNGHLQDIEWSNLFQSIEIEQASEIFYHILKTGIDLHIPKIEAHSPEFPI